MTHPIAAIQMVSGNDVDANLEEASRLLQIAAAQRGAKLAVLPESFALMGKQDTDNVAIRESEHNGKIQTFLAEQACKYKIWLVGGSIPLESSVETKVSPACLVFNDQGERVARYNKIHLFDVIAGNDRYQESDTMEPGNELVVVDTPFGRLGLAICYDLRFPEMFRCMAQQQMDILAIPAAFTAVTGRMHWEVLLRARAIENQCYVIACNQGGVHANGRETYGDSLVIDPWGVVLSRLPHGPGVVCADINLEHMQQVRANFPTLQHQKMHCDCTLMS